jgi:hypothetical protein
MSYKPAKWPTYANEALEDALTLMIEIERQAAILQRLTANNSEVVDIRINAMKAHSTLIQAKSGEYRRG